MSGEPIVIGQPGPLRNGAHVSTVLTAAEFEWLLTHRGHYKHLTPIQRKELEAVKLYRRRSAAAKRGAATRLRKKTEKAERVKKGPSILHLEAKSLRVLDQSTPGSPNGLKLHIVCNGKDTELMIAVTSEMLDAAGFPLRLRLK